jgi:ATP-dependent Clp protease ATP-binding subunit ClpC
VIQRELDDRIADLLVAAELGTGGTVTVTVLDGALHVAGTPARMPLAA